MKFVLKNPELEKEPIIELELKFCKDSNSIIVMGWDKNGKSKSICGFSNGKLILYRCASLLGLEIDEEGKIKIQ